ncbi:MAG: 16S rRNA (uracil(1498)-N(3))-methyltransferase, partial [uncultured Thermomicrobiales bacterium]
PGADPMGGGARAGAGVASGDRRAPVDRGARLAQPLHRAGGRFLGGGDRHGARAGDRARYARPAHSARRYRRGGGPRAGPGNGGRSGL